jgi:glycosyltransferase involved in cell wall biosynthesis
MEAMCCGAAVVVPRNGGSTSFVRTGENGVVVDAGSKQSCINGINSLILESGRRARFQRQALYDICNFYPEKGAYRTLEALFSGSCPDRC